MKTLTLIYIWIIVVAIAAGGCSAKSNSEKPGNDSIVKMDSLVSAEGTEDTPKNTAESSCKDSSKLEENRLMPSCFLSLSSGKNKSYYLLDPKEIISNLISLGFKKGKTKESDFMYAGETQYNFDKTDFTNDSQENPTKVTLIVYNVDKGGVCEDEIFIKISFANEKYKDAFSEDLLKMSGSENSNLHNIKGLYVKVPSSLQMELYTYDEISKFKK